MKTYAQTIRREAQGVVAGLMSGGSKYPAAVLLAIVFAVLWGSLVGLVYGELFSMC